VTERKTLGIAVPAADEPVGIRKKGRGWEIDAKRLDALHERAREMRRHPTPAQDALVEALKAVETGGYSFKRQDVIGSAIVDFACKPLMLIVEFDGDEDADFAPTRDRSLIEVGYRIERLNAADVLADPAAAAARVSEVMRERWHERKARARASRPARPAPRTYRDR
jgi:very-short-patch-repair endonuclease